MLDEWAEHHGYEAGMFRWMLLTAHLANEDWEQWRLSNEDVLAEKFLVVQSLESQGWHDKS